MLKSFNPANHDLSPGYYRTGVRYLSLAGGRLPGVLSGFGVAGNHAYVTRSVASPPPPGAIATIAHNDMVERARMGLRGGRQPRSTMVRDRQSPQGRPVTSG